ncbi:hypothetical protein [Cupriavidus sp. SW-Y-13]|uniref:hypothetical protein n=1 Tax=Cupriavidus sp. SW-Y-13 TaxID=2653854 RepID=UPI001365CF7D|nr:hypothetical protein [Cupriavidus sp. SW-Y-13]MWL91475.1 hypothetical protein [Cupriavidus sp. SW-Y-13]
MAVELQVTLTVPQAMAVLWHDAVYVPGLDKGVNDKASALLMRDQMLRDGWLDFEAGCQIADSAASIILDTVEHVPSTEVAKIVLDLDLHRLAVEASIFEKHATEIYTEYATLLMRTPDPALAWRSGRAAVYESFLARDRIYHSDSCAIWEGPARRNLECGLRTLRDGGADV